MNRLHYTAQVIERYASSVITIATIIINLSRDVRRELDSPAPSVWGRGEAGG